MPTGAQTMQPKFLFLGISTARSSSRALFPRWMELLGREEVTLEGVDLPLSAPAEEYRRFVERFRREPGLLGATITAHKIGVRESCADLFDEISEAALTCGEISAIYRVDGRLIGDTTDPRVSGAALAAFLGPDYWRGRRGEALILGAGGAGTALAYFLAGLLDPASRPARLILAERDPARLERAREILLNTGSDLPLEIHLTQPDRANDGLVTRLPPGSLVVNATGLGKDRPGSPLTDAARFPDHGAAWDLNYRGALDFLRQARAQADGLGLRVADGWDYFLKGWTAAIELALGIVIDPDMRARLFAEAAQQRTIF
jgi:shikimate dehydrogenase